LTRKRWTVDACVDLRQLGAVVRYAAKAGVTIPVVSTLYAVLLPQDRRARAKYAAELAASSLTLSSRGSTPNKEAAPAAPGPGEGVERRPSQDSWDHDTFEEQQQERHRRLEADYRRQSQEEEFRRRSLEESRVRRRSVDKVSAWFQRGD
jgi:hypothetical protein